MNLFKLHVIRYKDPLKTFEGSTLYNDIYETMSNVLTNMASVKRFGNDPMFSQLIGETNHKTAVKVLSEMLSEQFGFDIKVKQIEVGWNNLAFEKNVYLCIDATQADVERYNQRSGKELIELLDELY